MIRATLLDANMEPVSEDMEIDEDDFSAMEGLAAITADSGTKCCIQWSRTDDGQTAYWGPAGAVFRPHWYARLGRPPGTGLPPEEATKPRSIRLNDARWEKLKRLGSDWLARAIDRAREPK